MKSRLYFLIILGIAILSFVNLSQATPINNSHGLGLTLSGDETASLGMVIYSKYDQFITDVYVHNDVNATKLYLSEIIDANNMTPLKNVSLVGNKAELNVPVVVGKEYGIYVDSEGGSYNRRYRTSVSLPISNTAINWSRRLWAQNSTYYVTGAGALYNLVSVFTDIAIQLTSPSNGTEITLDYQEFNASIYNSDNLTNCTLYMWYNNGSLLDINFTNFGSIGNSSVNVSKIISDIPVGDFLWNYEACYENSTGSFLHCLFSTENWSISRAAATVLSEYYNNHTYETASETFTLDINLVPGAEISLAQLVYNGTNYTISNITYDGDNRTLTKTIDIPVNTYLTNETKEFFWRFTFTNAIQFVQQTETKEQNVSFINFQKCKSPYLTTALNFTIYDEKNQTNMETNENNTVDFESSWKYWVGGGTAYRNYSFQNLSSTDINYKFCMYPFIPSNFTFKINGDIDSSATLYRENEYHLRNATLTNVSSNILLYLLHQDFATKFFLTFKQGTTLLKNSIINVQKYFIGLGEFRTVGILETSSDGEATMWQEIDENYKYSVTQDGEYIGEKEKVSHCSTAPCTLTIIISDIGQNLTDPFYDVYAENVVSSLIFNSTTKIVTYTFLDTTGLANYFRLLVTELYYNQSAQTICDSKLYSPGGTLTCNLSSYSGEFRATGYVSRSPELVDRVLGIIISEDTIDSLGSVGLLLIIAILITVVFAGAVIGRGSPSVILIFLGLTILGLKLIDWFPFTWIVVVTLEFLILFLLWKVKV